MAVQERESMDGGVAVTQQGPYLGQCRVCDCYTSQGGEVDHCACQELCRIRMSIG